MLRYTNLEHRFVQYIPEDLAPGILYVSMEYATAAHSCCCGCGLQVVTPVTPSDWKLTYDGETISLWPSIGNWNFPCRSHYIIRHSRIVPADPWDDKKNEYGRHHEKKRKEECFQKKTGHDDPRSTPPDVSADKVNFWSRLKKAGKAA
jgi:hypothetical protein